MEHKQNVVLGTPSDSRFRFLYNIYKLFVICIINICCTFFVVIVRWYNILVPSGNCKRSFTWVQWCNNWIVNLFCHFNLFTCFQIFIDVLFHLSLLLWHYFAPLTEDISWIPFEAAKEQVFKKLFWESFVYVYVCLIYNSILACDTHSYLSFSFQARIQHKPIFLLIHKVRFPNVPPTLTDFLSCLM